MPGPVTCPVSLAGREGRALPWLSTRSPAHKHTRTTARAAGSSAGGCRRRDCVSVALDTRAAQCDAHVWAPSGLRARVGGVHIRPKPPAAAPHNQTFHVKHRRGSVSSPFGPHGTGRWQRTADARAGRPRAQRTRPESRHTARHKPQLWTTAPGRRTDSIRPRGYHRPAALCRWSHHRSRSQRPGRPPRDDLERPADRALTPRVRADIGRSPDDNDAPSALELHRSARTGAR